uniref:Uncharacterized protein n=1 Tax=viral metagenome TaxID=1070528 RepID=A0A6C0D8B6_9ZZZZ
MTNLINFDDTEKVLSEIYTLGGKQKATFLTEFCLYRLINNRSNSYISYYFQK